MLLGLVQPVEAHAHRGLGAHVAGTETSLQHLFDSARQAQFGGATHFLGGKRGRRRADRLAGARQQVAARIDDGDVLRPQAGHGCGRRD